MSRGILLCSKLTKPRVEFYPAIAKRMTGRFVKHFPPALRKKY